MKSFLPGSSIGILGGGQLGRMIALEARRMGYRTIVLDPAPGSPAAQVADRHIRAPVDDAQAALKLARHSDVVTLEWELIPAEILKKIEAEKPLHPSSRVLAIIQDRLIQKEFLKKNGFPQASYAAVDDSASLQDAAAEIGFPCILKRRGQGYDGKGQALIENEASLGRAKELLKTPCVLEAKVRFQIEVSVILARGQDGRVAVYPVAENAHRDGVLYTTRAPARISNEVQERAELLAIAVADSLNHVGVMAVEMFLLESGELLVNEVAPRPHNSGHFTLGACATSQFEQHLRAVSGLPLSDTTLLAPALMLNLLGDLWRDGEPRWDKLLRIPNLKLHLYGKAKPAPGRKMGHILLLGPDADRSLAAAEEILAEQKAPAERI